MFFSITDLIPNDGISLSRKQVDIVENVKKGYSRGYTSNYLDVYFKSDENLENKLVLVEITSIIDGVIYGVRKEN